MEPSASPLEYRPLRWSDVPSYLKLVVQGIGQLERATGLDQSAGKMLQMLSRRSIWALLRFFQLIGRPILQIYVAVDGKQVVGTGSLILLPKAAYVAGMVTQPEFRGKGVASRILAVLMQAGIRRQRDWLVLDVDTDNETAARVYRRAGYREVARFTWYLRTGVPPTAAPVASAARPARKSDLQAVAPSLDAGRPADYRAAMPATPRLLSHVEVIMSGRRVRRRTWVRRGADGSPLVLRASYAPEPPMGVYYPLAGPTPPTPDELSALLDLGADWLRPQAPKTCIAVVAEPEGAVGTALERLGFARVASSTTMIRSSSA